MGIIAFKLREMKQAKFHRPTSRLLAVVLWLALGLSVAWGISHVKGAFCTCALGGNYAMDANAPEDCKRHARDD